MNGRAWHRTKANQRMTGFFDSWRRKIGGVLLLVSLALMGLWIRSRQIDDVVRFTFFHRKHFIQSCRSEFGWWVWNDPEVSRSLPELTSDVLPAETPLEDVIVIVPGRRRLGQRIRHLDRLFAILQGDQRNWILPYWALVWPSTLLSALLLFWKPRRRETLIKTPNSEFPTRTPTVVENQSQTERAQP